MFVIAEWAGPRSGHSHIYEDNRGRRTILRAVAVDRHARSCHHVDELKTCTRSGESVLLYDKRMRGLGISPIKRQRPRTDIGNENERIVVCIESSADERG